MRVNFDGYLYYGIFLTTIHWKTEEIVYSPNCMSNCMHSTVLVNVYLMKQTISSSWMEFFMNSLQPILVDMRVDLRGGDIRVSQHHLNGSEVGTVGQQVSCK